MEEKSKAYNNYFICKHAYAQWYYKMKLLEFLIDNYDTVQTLPNFPKIVDMSDPTLQMPIAKKAIILSLKAEYFFSAMHISEAIFALMWAFEKDISKLWVLLANYRYRRDILSYVNDLASNTRKFSNQELNKIFFGSLPDGRLKNYPAIENSFENRDVLPALKCGASRSKI